MILDQNIFRQRQVPTLFRICSFKQPVDDVSLQYWDHIVTLLQVQKKTSNKNQQNKTTKLYTQILFSKGKQGHIVLWRFQNSCILYQKSLKIGHAIQKQITTMKTFVLKDLDQQKHQVYLLIIGYFDGVVEIFDIKLDQKQNSVSIHRQLTVKNPNQEPVRDVAIHNQSNLYVCRCHIVYTYAKLIQDVTKKILTKSKQQIKSSQVMLKLSDLSQSSKVSICLSQNNFHIYNQIQGMYSFLLPSMQNCGSVIDSIKYMVQTDEQDIILSSADDSFKILYAQHNEVQIINGLKSFVNSVVVNEVKDQKMIQLWIGDMYGEIHYMIKKKKRIVSKSRMELQKQKSAHGKINSQVTIFQESFTKGIKLIENGIKKLLIGKNLLIVVDTQMNILFYDIVRKNQTLTERQTS